MDVKIQIDITEANGAPLTGRLNQIVRALTMLHMLVAQVELRSKGADLVGEHAATAAREAAQFMAATFPDLMVRAVATPEPKPGS